MGWSGGVKLGAPSATLRVGRVGNGGNETPNGGAEFGPVGLYLYGGQGDPRILQLPFLPPTSLRAVTVIISTCLAKNQCCSSAFLNSSILSPRFTACPSSSNKWVRASTCLKCPSAYTPKMTYTRNCILKSCPWLTFPGPMYSDGQTLGHQTRHPCSLHCA